MRRVRPPSPLPARDGVAASRLYLPPGPWPTLWDFFLERFPYIQRDVLRARLDRGDIVDVQGRVQSATEPYRPHQWLWYYREVSGEVPLPFDIPIIYADDNLVVADKPHFMATTPGGRHLQETALVRLRKALDLPDLSPVHRLDRDTAGVVMFCVDPALRGRYQSLFQQREVIKEYEAVALWRDDLRLPLDYRSRLVDSDEDFRMLETPGVANSETRLELIGMLDDGLAHYRLLPLSGRKHQLRVHMSALGMPILNDEMYPALLPRRADGDFSKPLQLLARSLSFTDPVTGEPRVFRSTRELEMTAVSSSCQP